MSVSFTHQTWLPPNYVIAIMQHLSDLTFASSYVYSVSVYSSGGGRYIANQIGLIGWQEYVYTAFASSIFYDTTVSS